MQWSNRNAAGTNQRFSSADGRRSVPKSKPTRLWTGLRGWQYDWLTPPTVPDLPPTPSSRSLVRLSRHKMREPWMQRERIVKGVQQVVDSRIVGGLHMTQSAADTIDTGLDVVTSVVVAFTDDPTDTNMLVSVQFGDNYNVLPGWIIIKTWKTNGTDPTPIAATTFGKMVSWVAYSSVSL